MSTKTVFKRVALVAAAALAIGGITAVAANATIISGTAPIVVAGVTASAGTSTPTSGTATPTTSTYQAVSLTAGTADSYYTLTNSGVGTVNYTTDANNNLSASSSTVEVWSQGTGAIGTGSGGNWLTHNTLTFSAYSATAGTQTITIAGNVSSSITFTITWGGAAVVSIANSSSNLQTYAHASATFLSADDSVSVAQNAAAESAQIAVIVKDQNAAAFDGAVLSASVTGAGLVLADTATSTNTAGTARVTSVTLTGVNEGYIHISADGTAGTGTITVSLKDPNTSVTTVLATKTVTFYGTTPATISGTQNNFVAGANANIPTTTPGAGVAGSGALTISAKDSNGNLVGALGTTVGTATGDWYATSSNTACISSTITSVIAATSAGDGVGAYEIQLAGVLNAASGCTASVTVSFVASSTSTLVSAPFTFSVGGTSISSIALTTDAAAYSPGDKVTASLTALDSSSNPVADGSYGVFYDSTVTSSAALAPVTASAQLTSNPFGLATATLEKYAFVKGVATSTFYAPYTDGTVSVTSTLGTTNSGLVSALQGTTLAGSFSVSTGSSAAANAATDAANEATDAANAATDAANAAADSADAATQAAQDAGDKADAALAAVTALSQQVTTLLAKVASLAATLAAISKAIAKLPKK